MYWTLAKLGAIVVVLAVLWWAKGQYDERLREEGRSEVQAEWDAAAARERAAWTTEADTLREEASIARRTAEDEATAAGLVRAQLAATAGDLERLRGRCSVPPAVQRLFGGLAPAADGQQARLPAPADGAPRARETDCLADIVPAAVENELKVDLNEQRLMRCQRYSISLWQSCTGKQFNTAGEAPWLLEER